MKSKLTKWYSLSVVMGVALPLILNAITPFRTVQGAQWISLLSDGELLFASWGLAAGALIEILPQCREGRKQNPLVGLMGCWVVITTVVCFSFGFLRSGINEQGYIDGGAIAMWSITFFLCSVALGGWTILACEAKETS